MESVRSYSPTGISLPRVLGGSAPASAVSGPARCLLHITACRLAKSPKATLYIRGFSGFVTSTTAPIATGRSEPVPGRDFQPAVDQRLFTAHQQGYSYLRRATEETRPGTVHVLCEHFRESTNQHAIPNRRTSAKEKELLSMWCTTIWRTTAGELIHGCREISEGRSESRVSMREMSDALLTAQC